MSPPAVVLVFGPSLTRAEIPGVCQHLARRLAASDTERGGEVVVCDLGAVTRPDLVVVEALARLRLVTIRYGRRLHLRGAPSGLRELLVLAGLEAVLAPPAAPPLGALPEGEPPLGSLPPG